MNQEKQYNTSEFASIIGVHPQTLRNWDRKGIFKPARRRFNGDRVYLESQIDDYFKLTSTDEEDSENNENIE